MENAICLLKIQNNVFTHIKFFVIKSFSSLIFDLIIIAIRTTILNGVLNHLIFLSLEKKFPSFLKIFLLFLAFFQFWPYNEKKTEKIMMVMIKFRYSHSIKLINTLLLLSLIIIESLNHISDDIFKSNESKTVAINTSFFFFSQPPSLPLWTKPTENFCFALTWWWFFFKFFSCSQNKTTKIIYINAIIRSLFIFFASPIS